MNPLLQLLFNSLATRGVAKATENTPLSFIGKGLDYLDPFSYFKTTDKGLDSLTDVLGNFIGPEKYGTSQAQFENLQIPYDKEQGSGAFKNLVSDIYGEGGIMQGYNAVSAFGRGPVGAIENRISSIMNRSAPMTDFARNQIWSLYNARDQLVGGQGINTVTRPGSYSYDASDIPTTPGINLSALYDDLGQSSSGSDSGSSSSGSESFGGGFSTSSSGVEETF
jgi:hypothetical protein